MEKVSLKHYLLLIILLVTFSFFTSCKKNTSPSIPKSQFVTVYSELLVIQKLPISQKERLLRIKNLLNKNNLTEEQFILEKDRHKNDPDFWINVYKQTQLRLEKAGQEIQLKKKQAKSKNKL